MKGAHRRLCFQTSAPSFDLSQQSLERLGENDLKSLAFNPTLLLAITTAKHVGKMQLAWLISLHFSGGC